MLREKITEKFPFIIDFGNRILNKMNFSKTICLPKQALKNLDLEEGDSMKVELIQDEDERFLKLTPVIEDDDDESEEDDPDEVLEEKEARVSTPGCLDWTNEISEGVTAKSCTPEQLTVAM